MLFGLRDKKKRDLFQLEKFIVKLILLIFLFSTFTANSTTITRDLECEAARAVYCAQESGGNMRCSNGEVKTEYNRSSPSAYSVTEQWNCWCVNIETGASGPLPGIGCWTSYSDIPPTSSNDKTPPAPKKECGSIVQVDNQVVGEHVPVVGTDDQLFYFSDRVEGRVGDYTVRIPVLHLPFQHSSGAKIRLRVAGKEVIQNFPNATYPESSYWNYVWDGKDNQGRLVVGSSQLTADYLDILAMGNTTVPDYAHFSLDDKVGGLKSRYFGLGGWQLSSHHFYDSLRKMLHKGSGETQSAEGQAMFFNSSLNVIEQSETPNVTVVASSDGSEAYVFNMQTGVHLQTRSTRTGRVLKRFSYDSSGRLTRVEDAYANQINITRPSSTQVLITAPRGQVTTLTLNSSGWATLIRTPLGREYRATYKDSRGLLATFTQPNGAVATFTYDSKGYLTRDSNTSGALWSLIASIDPTTQNRSVETTSAVGRKSSYQIDFGTDTSTTRTETLPSGATRIISNAPGAHSGFQEEGFVDWVNFANDFRFQTDAPVESNRSTQRNSVFTDYLTVNSTQTGSFSPNNFLLLNSETLTKTDELGTSTRTYDGATRTYRFTSPMGRVVTQKSNDFDQLTELKIASFAPLTVSYDTRGRASSLTQGTRVTQLAYDSLGRVSSLTNPLSQVTQFTYNADGKMLTQRLPDGRQIQFNYDSNGNVSSLTPPSRPAHTFAFNLFDLVSNYTAPLVGTTAPVTQYTYNRDKQLTRITRPDASLIDFTYGSTRGLLSRVQTPDGAHNYTYTSTGKLARIASPGSVRLDYNFHGRDVLNQTTTAPGFSGKVEYGFEFLRPSSVTLTSGLGDSSSVPLIYDADSLLTQVGSMTIQRGSSTGLIRSTQLGQVKETMEYDSQFGEMSLYRVQVGTTQVFREDYVRNAMGQISGKTVVSNGATNTFSYRYDSAGRLIEVTRNGTVQSTYTYDANSNRLSVRRGTVTTSATYDAQDRLLSYGGNQYTHDLNGYRTLRTTTGSVESLALSYDALGALKQAVRITAGSTPGSSVSNTYVYLNDGMGRKVQRSRLGVAQVRYVYDEQSRVVGEINASTGAIKSHFVYGTRAHVPDYMIQGGVRYKFVHDHLGSVRMILNTSNGQVVSRMDYDEFGILQSGSLAPDFAPFGFAGGLRDAATGLVRFGARDYDPETGRWTAKDPILFNGGDANLYGYVLADPVNLIDPSGLRCKYSQGSGRLVCTDDNTGRTYLDTTGYAGTGPGRNNPSNQIPFEGPLPQGTYRVGPPGNMSNSTPGRPLAPIKVDCPPGRNCASFWIHGDNPKNDASNGCPIINRSQGRDRIPTGEIFEVTP